LVIFIIIVVLSLAVIVWNGHCMDDADVVQHSACSDDLCTAFWWILQTAASAVQTPKPHLKKSE